MDRQVSIAVPRYLKLSTCSASWPSMLSGWNRCFGFSPPGRQHISLVFAILSCNELSAKALPRAWTSCWYRSIAVSSAYFESHSFSAAGDVAVHREENGREKTPLRHPRLWQTSFHHLLKSSGSSPSVVLGQKSSGPSIFWTDWIRDNLDHFVCMYGFFYLANTTTSSQFMAHVTAAHAEHLFIQTLQYTQGTSIKTLLKVLTPTSTSWRCVLTSWRCVLTISPTTFLDRLFLFF